MHLVGAKNQRGHDPLYDASGTTVGGVQLIRPQVPSCSFIFVQNISAAATMYLEFGSARAAASLTSGAVSSIAVTNGGFGFTYPPRIKFAGGGNAGLGGYLGLGQPGGEGPTSTLTQGRQAVAHAVLTTGVVTSIVVDDPGAGYVTAPYVFFQNDPRDPYGCASPFYSSTASGILIGALGGNLYNNGTVCPTDAVSLYCSAASQAFTFKWMV